MFRKKEIIGKSGRSGADTESEVAKVIRVGVGLGTFGVGFGGNLKV